MKYFERLIGLRGKIPVLLLYPFFGRGVNLFFMPFVLNIFGNQGFIEVSFLLLMSFVLSVTIELGVKQKILKHYKSRDLLMLYYLRWIFSFTILLSASILLYSLINFRVGFIDTRDLIVVSLDALINVTLNSFYLGYLQAQGKANLILRINVQCLLLVTIPRTYLLLNGITDPWLWVLFGSIFRIFVFAKIATQHKRCITWNQVFCRKGIRLFDKGSMNSIFGVIVVLILSLDKFVGTHIYDSSSMAAYFVAFQFVTMSGSLYEQILVRYFPQVRDSLDQGDAIEHLRAILFGFLFVGSLLNGVYFAISLIAFPTLNAIFFPTLFLLSFQPLAWGVLIIWQNVIGLKTYNISHVKCISIGLAFDLLALSALYFSGSLGVVFLAGVSSSAFLVCLLFLSNISRHQGLIFVSKGELIRVFALFLIMTFGLYILRSSIYTVFVLVALYISLLLIRAYKIQLGLKIQAIFGSSR